MGTFEVGISTMKVYLLPAYSKDQPAAGKSQAAHCMRPPWLASTTGSQMAFHMASMASSGGAVGDSRSDSSSLLNLNGLDFIIPRPQHRFLGPLFSFACFPRNAAAASFPWVARHGRG